MAVLEFEFKGIDQNFRSSASNVLNDIDKIKKSFGSIGVGIGVDLKTALDGQKVALNDTKIQTQELVKAGKELDNQNKQTRNSIAELTLEQKKLTAEQRASRANLQDSPYSRLSRELNEMRNEAKNLGAQMILLDNAGMKSGVVYNTLSNKFNIAQKSANSLDNQIKSLDSSLGQNNRRVGSYGNALGGLQQKQSGANGVTMEFNRIIQDAPFGMMGIGNNLQQLAANWQNYTQQARAAAAANGTVVTNASLMRGALSALISPANLLTLGIAAITSAWTFYSMNTKTAKEETKDMNNQFTTQLGKLTNVISLTQKSALTERDKAIAVGLYNKELGDTLGKVKTYSELEKTLIKNGSNYVKYLSLKSQAEATYQISLKQTAQMMTNIMSLESKGRSTGFSGWVSKASDTIDELVYGEGSQGKTKITSAEAMRIAQLPTDKDFYIAIRGMGDALKKGLKDVRKDWKKSIQSSNLGGDLTQEFNKIADGLNLKMPDLNLDKTNNESTKKGNQERVTSLKDQRDYLLEIQQILQNSQSRVDTSGEILNWDKELIKVHDYYDKQEIALQKMLVSSQRAYKDDSAKRQQIEQSINSTRITLYNNMINELSKIDDKYFSEGMAKVAELNAKYSDSMDLDTRSNALKKVRDEFAKLREEFKNDPIISQEMLDKWQENQTLKVNREFDNKDLEEWGKINDKIQETIDKPFSGQNPKSIQAELEKRIDIIKRLLEKLSRATGQPFDQSEFDRLSTELKNKSTEKYNTEQAKKDIQDYVTIANNGLNSVFTNLKSNIDEFGWKARSVFYTLGETLGDLIKQLANKNTAKFMESITKDAKSFSDLKDNWKNMSSQDKWSAGLGFAGSAVSSLTPQTSSGGQAVGGALSGAAAGMAFGPWGAAIGAVAGGVSGLLKASKNRRQEKILLQQYEEQKKANALLERMNALTYASQIIGQKTEYGIVSGVRRNEFGQIVSVVQGQDIIMVADRTNKQKGR